MRLGRATRVSAVPHASVRRHTEWQRLRCALRGRSTGEAEIPETCSRGKDAAPDAENTVDWAASITIHTFGIVGKRRVLATSELRNVWC